MFSCNAWKHFVFWTFDHELMKKNKIKYEVGQAFENPGGGFAIKEIIGSVALCRFTNGKVKPLSFDKLSSYKMVASQITSFRK